MSEPQNKAHDLKFSETHEWVRVIDEHTVKVGISDYAVDLLKDITYIELPDEGDFFHVGDSFGEIESVKAASELYSPVQGEICEVNKKLDSFKGIEILTHDPYGEGWMVKIKLDKDNNLSSLMDYSKYKEFVKKEA
jgi:glycine cleavage system H protein